MKTVPKGSFYFACMTELALKIKISKESSFEIKHQVFYIFNSERTDGKLLLLEISKSHNCSLVECLNCVQFHVIGVGSIKSYTVVEHFYRSHPQIM